jgi:hypothetical protein
MIKLKDLITDGLEVDYRGEHSAPSKSEGASLDNLSQIYPDDIYSGDGARMYGDGIPLDVESVSIIKYCRNKPNAQVKIYRAVPDVNKDVNVKIKHFSGLIFYIEKFGFAPIYSKDPFASELYRKLNYNKAAFVDHLTSEIEKLENLKLAKLKINAGDWVTINKGYAREHGKSTLMNKYIILSKTVSARTLYTTGDSIHEWGYNP